VKGSGCNEHVFPGYVFDAFSNSLNDDGDFHGWNVHMAQDHMLTVFDFDCCGVGWRAYDIAVLRWGARLRGKEQARWPSFLCGYGEVRRLSDLNIQATPYFGDEATLFRLAGQLEQARPWCS
jgi:Ser/Thr protein kinase RdoA (MazF antagonist)